MKSAKVAVLGAGVSGLIAALELEAKGFQPILIEASDRVGGRLRSDQYDSFALDHGFQVLLTNYPELKRYDVLSNLHLKEFRPGALVFEDQDPHRIGDAFRDRSFLSSTVFSSVASLRDKMTLLLEQRRIAQTKPEAIFAQTTAQTTLDYLS
ncbi:MAG: FAD-dependent oxidoreductase, partial [Flavobacteriaceae bacterium]